MICRCPATADRSFLLRCSSRGNPSADGGSRRCRRPICCARVRPISRSIGSNEASIPTRRAGVGRPRSAAHSGRVRRKRRLLPRSRPARCRNRRPLHPRAARPRRPAEAGDRDHPNHRRERLRASRRALGLGQRVRASKAATCRSTCRSTSRSCAGARPTARAGRVPGQGRRPELGQRLRPVHRPLHPRARAQGGSSRRASAR